jgi:glyoxylase-like metal-dependent hydrolase (beta-lactamase superfamily II)/rhodanese-related sulfurtransferase
MYFNQIAVNGLGCLSYCIGCPGAKQMMVVDPKRDIQDYLDIAYQEGMSITHIINTHLHADHISGDQELSSATGADIYINDSVKIDYPHKNIVHGDVFTLGAAKVEVLHTPGHTPNSISLVVTDTGRSSEPEMILTGDLLFVGDVGRPDLPGSEILDEQVENLYNSLYKTLAGFPDYLEVYPAHGEGSLCGRGMSAKKNSTLGYERSANHMLQFDSFEAFKKDIMSAFPVRPKSFTHIISTNKKGADLLDACTLDKRLTPGQFQELMQEKNTLVMDTRDSAAYGGFHIPGSINIGFEKQVANWVGMVIEPGTELLLVVESSDAYYRMLTELHRVGYDAVLGYLSGGINAWLMSGRPVDQLAQISPHQFYEESKTDCPLLLDVRTLAEWESGHISGAVHFPLSDILGNKMPKADKKKEMVVQCGSGYRSNIAAAFLKEQGFTNIKSLAGGLFAWSNANFPLADMSN